MVISKATDEELNEVFKEMRVSAPHKVELREAVAAWRADPQRVLFPPCAAQRLRFCRFSPALTLCLPRSPHPIRRCEPSNVKVPLKQSGSEIFGRRRSASKRLLKQSGGERFGKRRSASKRLLKQSGNQRFGKRRSARLQLWCCFPPLRSGTPISFVLQAAAASRLKGKYGILDTIALGNSSEAEKLKIVRDHLTVDPHRIECRDGM